MFRGFRYRRGLTQEAFAMLAGLPVDLVSEWEAHKRAPSPSTLRDLATTFDVSVSDLLRKPPKDVSLRFGGSTPWAGPTPVVWDTQLQARWGQSPFALYGYFRLQLKRSEAPRWYPISGEQAWWLNHQLLTMPASTGVIVTKTLNNRVLIFGIEQVFGVLLLTKAQSLERDDFQLGWDDDGLPPEICRLLRNWARNDNSQYFGSSPALYERREAVLGKPGMRRRKTITALVDNTYVFRFSDAPIVVSVDAANLQTAVRSLPLGMLTAYFAERGGAREWLVPVEDIRLIELPALDLEEFRQFDVIVKPD